MKKPQNQILSSKVTADYNKIAPLFSSTRSYSWPEMAEFSQYLKNKDRVLDLGCGNGRLLTSFKKQIEYLGLDNSKKLLKIAQESYPTERFLLMDMTSLELKNDSFDACFAVASLHHLPTKLLRRKAVTEAFRVTRPGGYFFVTVWNLWQPKYRKYIFKNFINMIFRGAKTHFGDTFIPFKDKNRNLLAERYYFAYTKLGLSNDLKSSGFKIEKLVKNRWNFYAICKK